MSTFDGFIQEFPQIRVDYFRLQPHRPAPLACFLSHIHSDHLAGLESFKGPFIYCSAVTREILLRLERYPHRMNFARGVTEARKQTYKHLSKLLRPLPIETPTRIELAPGNAVTVTLFDANHCAGAVMFLIETSTQAVLYTGDIRAEEWWVNVLARSPFLIPYIPRPVGAGTKRLDCVYLDTTFATKSAPLRTFPSKAEGVGELIRKLGQYPVDTQFYFHAWTFGYEDVLRALSHALQSRIHLDRYRYDVYTSLSRRASGEQWMFHAPDVAAFSGYTVGNIKHESILTRDDSVRLHSCEQGTSCWSTDPIAGADVVHIKPIITRHEDEDIQEAGVGGGKGDLDQIHELDLGDVNAIAKLMEYYDSKISDVKLREEIKALLSAQLKGRESNEGRLRLGAGDDELTDSIRLDQLAVLLQRRVHTDHQDKASANSSPNLVTFPYSRHSSYQELRTLIDKFRPRSVFPCTAPKPRDFDEERSMANLFGDVCLRDEDDGRLTFRWDEEIRAERTVMLENKPLADSRGSDILTRSTDWFDAVDDLRNAETQRDAFSIDSSSPMRPQASIPERLSVTEQPRQWIPPCTPPMPAGPSSRPRSSSASTPRSAARLQVRRDAFAAAVEGRWKNVHLQSVGKKRRRSEEL